MALVLQIPPGLTNISIGDFGAWGVELERKRSRRNYVSTIGLRLCGNGTVGSDFGHVAEEAVHVFLVRSAAETGGTEKKTCSRSLRVGDRGFVRFLPGYGMSLSPVDPRGVNLKGYLINLMANLQLLGFLTALGMGMDVRRADALSLVPPYSTGRKLRSSCVEKDYAECRQLNQCEEVDEDAVGSARRPGSPELCQDGADVHGVTSAAEDVGCNEEAKRERAELRANPYEITVPIKIVGLRGSVPPAWLKDFMGSQGKRVKLMAEFRGSLRGIFVDLSSAVKSKQLTSRSAMAADLVTIGDSWLDKAVSGGLIKPIENAEQFEWYQRLGTKWQSLVRRDNHGSVDPHGKVWGVPYRWGSVVIAYNSEKLQKQKIPAIKDWADLWKPELTGRISMVASPREVIGAVLKALGSSYNVNDFQTDVPGGRQALKEKYVALQKQVLLFDDVQYLKTLGAGEVWVAVGWSEDVIPFAKRTNNISVIVPQSGTSLWADLWAIPATTSIKSTEVGGRIRGPSPLILQWLDFCLQPARANSFQHNVLMGASPLTFSEREVWFESSQGGSGSNASNACSDSNIYCESLLKEGRSNTNQVGVAGPNPSTTPIGLLTPDVLAKSEFLEPLSKAALGDFKWLLPEKKDRQASAKDH